MDTINSIMLKVISITNIYICDVKFEKIRVKNYKVNTCVVYYISCVIFTTLKHHDFQNWLL